VRDVALWVRCIDRAKAAAMALLSRLPDGWRQAHTLPSHD
jgi:hypothetical protein